MSHELPMIAEWEAQDRVEAVFVDIRRAFPYVPMLFRALALQPVGLILAWEHARSVLRSPHILEAALRLEKVATPTGSLVRLPWHQLSPFRQDALRAILDHFAQTMPVHGLMLTSLGLALAGETTADPVTLSDWRAEGHPMLMPTFDLIEPDDAPQAVRHRFAQIRSLVGLPYIEAFWRALASDPILLDAVWNGVSRQTDRHGFLAQETRTCESARHLAASLTPPHVLSPMALTRAGIAETLPAILRLIGMMAGGALRHTVICMALSADIERQSAQAA
ncbi:MAG: hypothetical protein H7338_09195 [Candidatus Sericytochromatia bacterium]|nr:hypothetical protein [Candidatus Sericytochromatia bacterium]